LKGGRKRSGSRRMKRGKMDKGRRSARTSSRKRRAKEVGGGGDWEEEMQE
jgi:hypothetical protein